MKKHNTFEECCIQTMELISKTKGIDPKNWKKTQKFKHQAVLYCKTFYK